MHGVFAVRWLGTLALEGNGPASSGACTIIGWLNRCCNGDESSLVIKAVFLLRPMGYGATSEATALQNGPTHRSVVLTSQLPVFPFVFVRVHLWFN